MAELPALVADVLDRADSALVSGWYNSVSIHPERVRAWLRFRGLPFVDPALPPAPPLSEVDHTAELVISRASTLVGALGGAAGLVGAASVPPEWVAANIAVLRLAQRLCVVYGFDPDGDRGQMALCRTLAAGYDVQLPETGPMRMRLRDLAALAGPGRPEPGMGGRIARAMAVSSAWWVAGQITRFVPVVAASTHAWDAQRKVDEIGHKMLGVLRRLAEAPIAIEGAIEEAVELGASRR